MKESPILFKDRLVRAILEGRKTQTRRLIKPALDMEFRPLAVEWYNPTVVDRHGNEQPGPRAFGAYDEERGRICPYGGPGDRLWVREAWGVQDLHPKPPCIVFRADFPGQSADDAWVEKWRPSIHLPRAASRLLLDIVQVRVERLQAITEEDARAEGAERAHETAEEGEAPCGSGPCGGWLHPSGVHTDTARETFRDLWDSINGKRPGASWRDNPWVWVIEFNEERLLAGVAS